MRAAGKQVPITFELPYDPTLIDERNRYAIQVRILDGGQVRFTNSQAYAVIICGHPKTVNVVERIRQSASNSSRLSFINAASLCRFSVGMGLARATLYARLRSVQVDFESIQEKTLSSYEISIGSTVRANLTQTSAFGAFQATSDSMKVALRL